MVQAGLDNNPRPHADAAMTGLSPVMSPRSKLVYLVRREGLSSVFMSQVIQPMSLVAESGMDVEIVVMAPVGQFLRRHLRDRWANVLASLPPSLTGKVHCLLTSPSRIDWPWFENRRLIHYLRKRKRATQPLIVQCRNSMTVPMALYARRRLSNVRVVFDCRGVLDHEFLHGYGTSYETASESLLFQATELAERERLAVVNADAVFCVSDRMKDYLVAKHGVPGDRFTVVPCCVDVARSAHAAEGRDKIRQQLGLNGRFVVTYCGSIASYQMLDESFTLFTRIKRLAAHAHFLAITTHPDQMKQAADSAGISADDTTIISVPHEQVASYLAAGDAGLLLRENIPINHVASPVKFGEYLASGTPVLMSEGIGDFSKLAHQEELGLVIYSEWTDTLLKRHLQDFIESYGNEASMYRARCQQAAQQHLNFLKHLPNVLHTYTALSEPDSASYEGAVSRQKAGS